MRPYLRERNLKKNLGGQLDAVARSLTLEQTAFPGKGKGKGGSKEGQVGFCIIQPCHAVVKKIVCDASPEGMKSAESLNNTSR